MAKKIKRALRKAAKAAVPMLAVAGLGKAFMNARNRKAMLEGADANEGFIDSMIPMGPFIKRKPKMMTPQDMANDPMFLNAMAAKGGRIMKTKRGGKAVKGFGKKKKQANKMRKK
jgi:hypothetical protein